MSALPRFQFEEFRSSDQLPSPGGVALEIMRLTQRDDVGMPEICRVLQADPALSGRLVKLANSVAAGGTRPAASVSDAVARLGMHSVRQLALGFSLIAGHGNGKCVGFDYAGFWSRSLACAIAAKSVSSHLKLVAAEEFFTLGLLGRVGGLALASIYPDLYGPLLTRTHGRPLADLRAAEREAFAVDQAEITAAMLAEWTFPKPFTEVAYHHYDPEAARLTEGSRLALMTHSLNLAAGIADLCVHDDPARRRLLPQLYRLAGRVGIEDGLLDAMVPAVAAEWREWGRLLDVGTADVPTLEEIQQARQEVAEPEPVPGVATRHPLRILAVDDDRVILAMQEKLLTMAGHHVMLARDGEAAMKQVLRDPPQLVITDWEMPGMNGAAFCRALRETRPGRLIYVIMLTGHGSDERLAEAFAAGVDDYMIKPLKPRELLARLRAGQRFVELQQSLIHDSEEVRNIASELAIANRRLGDAARTDSLTDMPNRRFVLERLEQELALAERKQTSLSVLLADIDHFKNVNDRHGHATGDQILRRVAKLLRAHCRNEDTPGRVGGEEFLVVCPETDQAGAEGLGNRLRVALEGLHRNDQGMEPVTLSIGIATRRPGEATKDLLARADKALYQAKGEGRNRVCAA